MKNLYIVCLAVIFVGCGTSDSNSTSISPVNTGSGKSGNKNIASNLPDRISCLRTQSAYKLVLILKDAKLPGGVSAIGLKAGDSIAF